MRKMSNTTCCGVCGTLNQQMKLCTRCRDKFYCSRECQVKDWNSHRMKCKTTSVGATDYSKQVTDSHQAEVSCARQPSTLVRYKLAECTPEESAAELFMSDCDVAPRTGFKMTWSGGSTKVRQCRTDMTIEKPLQYKNNADKGKCSKQSRLSAKKKSSLPSAKEGIHSNNSGVKQAIQRRQRNSYMHNDQICCDIPEIQDWQSIQTINVRANKEKHKVDIQCNWCGEEIFKVLAHRTSIPFDQIKLIHKGKIITPETIRSVVQDKSVFLAIGEKAEDETQLSADDITVIMRQLKVSRNEAVRALNENGSVIDAMISLGNKK